MSTPPRAVVACAAAVGCTTYLVTRRSEKQGVFLALSVAATLGMDGSHFVRVALGDLSRYLFPASPPRSVHGEDRARYRVWPCDVDRNGHMNNAKFLRVANYARRSFWSSNGVWRVCLERTPRTNLIVTATSIRYRREFKLFDTYEVVSRLRFWDEKCFYTEHRFEKDGFVHACQLVKYRVVGGTPADLIKAVEPSASSSSGTVDDNSASTPPDLATMPELQAWIDYDTKSSVALRRETQ